MMTNDKLPKKFETTLVKPNEALKNEVTQKYKKKREFLTR